MICRSQLSGPKWSSRQCRRALTVIQHQLAVDEHMLRAGSRLPTVIIRGPVGDRVRIEDNDIGRHSFTEQAPVLQSKAARAMGRKVLDRLLQRPGAIVADIVTEITGEAAP